MADITVGGKVFEAIGYLFIAAIAYFVYGIGKRGLGEERRGVFGDTKTVYNDNATVKDVVLRLLKGLGIIVIIGFVAAYVFLGNSSDCTDADPLYGGCTTTQEYEPKSQERIATAAYWITLLGVPYLLSGYNAYTTAKTKQNKEGHK